jgi:hypothetical protein
VLSAPPISLFSISSPEQCNSEQHHRIQSNTIMTYSPATHQSAHLQSYN